MQRFLQWLIRRTGDQDANAHRNGPSALLCEVKHALLDPLQCAGSSLRRGLGQKHGKFVASKASEIMQAIRDFSSSKFGQMTA